MTDQGSARPPIEDEISRSLASLWSDYSHQRPSEVRTEIRGNTVTTSLIDAVKTFDRAMITPQDHDTVRGVGKLTLAGYKRHAVAAVAGLTRQRVTRLVSSHDRDTDVATEIFTLEASLLRGRPAAGETRSRSLRSSPDASRAVRRPSAP